MLFVKKINKEVSDKDFHIEFTKNIHEEALSMIKDLEGLN